MVIEWQPERKKPAVQKSMSRFERGANIAVGSVAFLGGLGLAALAGHDAFASNGANLGTDVIGGGISLTVAGLGGYWFYSGIKG